MEMARIDRRLRANGEASSAKRAIALWYLSECRVEGLHCRRNGCLTNGLAVNGRLVGVEFGEQCYVPLLCQGRGKRNVRFRRKYHRFSAYMGRDFIIGYRSDTEPPSRSGAILQKHRSQVRTFD